MSLMALMVNWNAGKYLGRFMKKNCERQTKHCLGLKSNKEKR